MTDKTTKALSEDLSKRAGDALKHFLNPNDEIQFFDPQLSVISPESRYRRISGGYKIWPEDVPETPADLKIMSMGNSTSLWPYYPWSLELAEMLDADGHRIELWHSAGKGSTSSQELMRVVRDAPTIKPNLIVCLSGICDIGYLLNAAQHPFLHKYSRRVLDFALGAGLVTRQLVYGPPHDASPAEVWCRNQRFAKVLADEMGIEMLTFLQPVQGYGRYPASDEEKAMLEQKSKVVLKAAHKPYGECVTEFYTEVQERIQAEPGAYSHVIDFTEVFVDCPGAYRDHRHQTPLGVTHLAKSMRPYVEAAVVKGRQP